MIVLITSFVAAMNIVNLFPWRLVFVRVVQVVLCFSIFHNFAIGRFLHKQKQAGNPGIHCTVNPQAPFHLRKQLAGNPELLDSLDFLLYYLLMIQLV